jgi:chemotaxis family two-component system sensor kinase Cph1
LQAKTAGSAAGQFHNAAARVAAIATVHQQLHRYDDVGTVALDRLLIELCQGITSASSSPDRTWPLIVDAGPIIIATDIAVPLALIVNELVTNAIQHSRPASESGSVHIVLKQQEDNFSISVSDPGGGLRPLKPPTSVLDTPD